MPLTTLLADALLGSSALPGYAVDPAFYMVPLAILLARKGAIDKARDPAAVLSINGEPQHLILARLNAKKGEPRGKKIRAKPLGKKGDLRQEADRAEVKAVLRQHAAEDHRLQQAYEVAFRKQRRWKWQRVEKELKARSLNWAGLAILAAELGIVIDMVARHAA